jgi:hypothetical protein
LGVAFGFWVGPAPDRLVIGLAVLSLFSAVAEDRPLVCSVDDIQWLDSASGQVLAFLGRRLVAESVALIMATRAVNPEMTKLPQMELSRLCEADARALLDMVWTGRSMSGSAIRSSQRPGATRWRCRNFLAI